jgi:hypothetical protein
MLETLAGRLKWEHTGTGIRVEIPARLDWTTLFFVVWLAGWSVAGWHVILDALSKPNVQPFNLLWLVGWAAGECFVIASVVWSLAGNTTLMLDSSTLEINRRIAGIQLDRRSFATTSVHNLRYIPAANRGRRSYGSQICFEADGKTRAFASKIEDAEAFALIDRLLDVYMFPKDRAMEYLDLSS